MHITQSQGMADCLSKQYRVRRAIPISNSVLYANETPAGPARGRVATIGFLSNISEEKGIIDFLDLLGEVQAIGWPIRGKIGGSFEGNSIKLRVLDRLKGLPHVDYLGEVHGADKDQFFEDIDVFAFPTRYSNETEAKVNHEAMSRGVPVIAYGRGCIPEIVDSTCGLVVHPEASFVDNAIPLIERWLSTPEEFRSASEAAAARFAETRAESYVRWQALISELAGDVSTAMDIKSRSAS